MATHIFAAVPSIRKQCRKPTVLLFCPALFPGVVHGIVHPALAGYNELRDGHEFIAILKQRLNDAGQSLGRMQGSVVKQHNGTRLYLGCDPLGDLVRRDLLPVQTVHVPNSFKLLEYKGCRLCSGTYHTYPLIKIFAKYNALGVNPISLANKSWIEYVSSINSVTRTVEP